MVLENYFIAPKYTVLPQNGTYKWSAPSNIALVKYWGKKENQIPANPSLSFTLQNCKTTTSLSFLKVQNQDHFSFDFFLDAKPKEDFKPKVLKFLERIFPYCPYLKEYHFTIQTQNTFPHSSGIASSASGMAALAVNIMSLEKNIYPQITDDYFYKKASFLARLGSGSACRSIKGSIVSWGEHAQINNSSNLYGTPITWQIHDYFANYQDTILLVDKGEKQVSSTLGHHLMHNHPYAQSRFAQAHNNIVLLQKALQTGDSTSFIALVESEALTLHAMMMTSMPYYILMKPNTMQIINAIWEFRQQTKIPVCFTLDAGANVHVLYPEKTKTEVLEFIQNKLVAYCQNGHYICDQIGAGAMLL